jgi:putative DNA primase/helicase
MTREALALVGNRVSTPAKSRENTGFDMDVYLGKHGFEMNQRKSWQSQPGGLIYELVKCPFDNSHIAGSAAFTLLDGKPGFKCQHAGCAGKSISDVFALFPAERPKQTRSGNLHRGAGKDPRSAPSLESQPAAVEEYGSFGSFRVSDEGVFFLKEAHDGTPEAIRLAARIDILAETRDANGNNWGRLLSWRDNESRVHQWTMPMESLASDAGTVRARLLCEGLPFLSTNSRWRERLTEYLQTSPVERRILSVSRVGWHGETYVLPNETFGPLDRNEILYHGPTGVIHYWGVNGKHTDWRERIGEKCSGNSRLIIAVSCAFAGPLLSMAETESGGIHFHGASSTGKSTALAVGGSVCGGGGPAGFVQSWRATVNGLEAIAEAHNHGTLFLDELAQVDPREAAEAAYLIANGQGKGRMTRELTSQKKLSWTLLFVSAGELTLAEHVSSAGKRTKGGAEVRLLNIQADAGKGWGMFENLHGALSPEAFVRQVKEAALQCYGAPIRRYLRHLATDRAVAMRVIHKARERLGQSVPLEAAGEARRAADRFALIGVAGELATQWGLTGWKEGESVESAQRCFNEWMESRGTVGNSDLEAAIRQVCGFIGAHGASRFQALRPSSHRNHDTSAVNRHPMSNRAGFSRLNAATHEPEYLILPETFRTEVCAGQDFMAVARELAKRGFLVREGTNLTIKPRLPEMGSTRVYCIRAAVLEAGEC